ncbi:MAG TPA: tRNA pseudouridine(38-40) synthase TruA [Labilithrix sp.]|nr:tRNA pseudouridine(38-40) synthase TruA [Labilithrix sp.]
MIPEHGVLLTLGYDGTSFSGWATQKDARTVEEVLRGAILALDPRAAGPRGCSRTDAGVHAEGQLAAFDARLFMPPRGWVLTLNQNLPDDVSVRAARAVGVSYNPRFTSRKKRYRYLLMRDKVRDPLLRDRAWRVGYDMDMEKLQREALSVLGTHDFAAFRSAKDERGVTIRTMHSIEVSQLAFDPRLWTITIEGNSFMYNMVRILVGTLVDVARDNLPEGTITRALAGKMRLGAGQTAPAHGLTLEHIDAELPSDAGAPWPP